MKLSQKKSAATLLPIAGLKDKKATPKGGLNA